MAQEYIRPTKIMAYFKEKGIRVSGDAKVELIKKLNESIEKNINNIIDKLPKITKGDNKGELKRKTIMPDDLG